MKFSRTVRPMEEKDLAILYWLIKGLPIPNNAESFIKETAQDGSFFFTIEDQPLYEEESKKPYIVGAIVGEREGDDIVLSCQIIKQHMAKGIATQAVSEVIDYIKAIHRFSGELLVSTISTRKDSSIASILEKLGGKLENNEVIINLE